MITVERPLRKKKDYFDTIADNWKSTPTDRDSQVLEYTLHETVGAAPGKRILDIGCGTGIAFKYLDGYNVIALDLSARMIQQAKVNKTSSVDFLLQADTHRLPLQDNSVDGIIALALYPHVIDKSIFLDECHRVLRPDGSFGIIHLLPAEEINRIHKEAGEILEDDILPEAPELIRQLEATGFEPVKVEHNDFYFILSKKSIPTTD